MVGSANAATDVPTLVPYAANLDLHMFRSGNQRGAAAILLFHPGGWVEGDPKLVHDVARAFAAEGVVAFAVQYRLSNEVHTPVDAFDDTCAALRYVSDHAAELRIDPARIAAYGESAGAQLAALSATRGCAGNPNGATRPKLLLLQSPILDPASVSWFPRIMKGAPPDEFSPRKFASHETPETLIIQGDKDVFAPVTLSRRFCAEVTRPGVSCTVITIPRVGHYFTRTLNDQDGQFNPFSDSTTQFVPDDRARREAIRTFSEFLKRKGF